MGTVVTNILSPAQAQQIAADNKKRFDDMVAGRIPRHRPAPKDPVVEAEEKAYYEEFQEWERRDQYPTNWEATVMRMHQNGLLLPDDSDEDDEYAFLEVRAVSPVREAITAARRSAFSSHPPRTPLGKPQLPAAAPCSLPAGAGGRLPARDVGA
eukprot:6509859-Prymnesium_polylepis.2